MATPARVLIVDDEIEIVGLLRDFFAEAGYLVDFALHGGDALTVVQHDRPDVVLLDIDMPGIDGIQVLERIRALEPPIPVIMVTANANASVLQETMAMGAFGYVTKPFNLSGLKEIVDAAIAPGSKGADGVAE